MTLCGLCEQLESTDELLLCPCCRAELDEWMIGATPVDYNRGQARKAGLLNRERKRGGGMNEAQERALLLAALQAHQQRMGLTDTEMAHLLRGSYSLWYKVKRGQRPLGYKVSDGARRAIPDLARNALQGHQDGQEAR